MHRSGKNNERAEQVRKGKTKPSKIEPLRPQVKQDKLWDEMAKFLSECPYPVLRVHRDGTVLFANEASEALLKAKNSGVGLPAPSEWCRLVKDVLASGEAESEEMEFEGRIYGFNAAPIAGRDYVNFYGMNITEQKRTQEALLFTRFLVDNAVDTMVCVEHDGHFIDVNNAFCRISGYSREELLSMTVHDIDPDYSAEIWPEFWEKLKQSGSLTFESCHRTKEGKVFPVEITANYFEYNGKEYHCSFARDITERKKAEERVKAERQRLYDVLETLPVMVFLLTPDYHVTFANRRFREKFGEDKGRHCFDYIFGRKGPCEFCEAFNVLKTGKPHHWECTRPEGGSIIDVYDYPFTDTDGSPLILEMDIDITEHKQAEQKLRESEERFRSLFEQSADAVVVVDAQTGEMVEFNDKANEMLGYTRQEFAKLRLSDIEVIESEEEITAHIDKIARQNGDIFETRHRTKDGTVCDVLVSTKSVTIGGRQFVQGIWRDITQIKAAEQKLVEDKKRLKQLASQLALTEERERRQIAGKLHDQLCQSMALAKIKLDALRAYPNSESAGEDLKQVSDAMQCLIDQMRSLVFDLSSPILYEVGFEAAVAEWLNEQVRDKHGIAVEFQDDGLPKPLDNDVQVLLFRNVRELLINVIKHSRASKVKVSIRRVGDFVEVAVEDNGVGFDLAEAKAISVKEAKFGLFSIRESVEHLGGRFEIESRPDAGCRAVMTVPLKGQESKKEGN